MLRAQSLLAEAIRGSLWQTNYGTRAYWIGLGLLVIVLILVVCKAYREWQEIHDVEEPDSPDDLLQSFREAHALGELDDDEMRRVEQRLSNGLAPLPSLAKPAKGAPTRALAQQQPSSKPAGEGPNVVAGGGAAPPHSDSDTAQGRDV
jgi:hypothetical protein